MNIAIQHVAPEEIMALLDGELANDQTRALEAHIEQCAECSQIAEQLRATSQSLSAWTVPAIPRSLDDAISAMGEKSASLTEIPEPELLVRVSFWTWKQWTLSAVGALATLVIVAGIMLPDLNRSGAKAVFAQHQVRESIDSFNGRLQESPKDGNLTRSAPEVIVRNGPASIAKGGGGGGGDRDKLQPADSVSAPMIARTVSLSIVVKDLLRVRTALDAMLSRHHGYAAQLNVSTPENAPRGLGASLRIPAPALESAIADLRTLGRVENESQSGEDVTKQHTDLLARLKNSRETEERFRAILETRAGKITEVLQVEEEIARVRGEIEGMEAEQKALEHRVDFASVDLQLTEEYKAALNPPAPSVATRIHNALVAGYQNAQETVLGILLFFMEDGPTIMIWLAILAFPALLLWRRFRRMAATV